MKKVVKFLAVSMFVSLFFALTTFASIPNGTVVMGNKAYDIGYANSRANIDEISSAVVECNNHIYVKEFDGNWVQNDINNTPASENAINVATYKDANGNVTNYNSSVENSNSSQQYLTTTVESAVFGSNITISLSQNNGNSNIAYYQVFNNGNQSSAKSTIGDKTTVFPAKQVGDSVTVELFDNNNNLLYTIPNVILGKSFCVNPNTNNNADNSGSVKAIVMQEQFGADVFVYLTDEGKQKYSNAEYFQVLDNSSKKVISQQSELKKSVIIFPAQRVGDKIAISLYDSNSNKIETINNIVLQQPSYDPSDITIISVETYCDSIKQGQNVTFPTYVTAHMSDGTLKTFAVSWDNKDMNISQPGNYTYYGTVNGFNGKAEFVLTVQSNGSSNNNSAIQATKADYESRLTKALEDLNNAKNNKTIRELTKNTDGTYDWTYVADQNKVNMYQTIYDDIKTDYDSWKSEMGIN